MSNNCYEEVFRKDADKQRLLSMWYERFIAGVFFFLLQQQQQL